MSGPVADLIVFGIAGALIAIGVWSLLQESKDE